MKDSPEIYPYDHPLNECKQKQVGHLWQRNFACSKEGGREKSVFTGETCARCMCERPKEQWRSGKATA